MEIKARAFQHSLLIPSRQSFSPEVFSITLIITLVTTHLKTKVSVLERI